MAKLKPCPFFGGKAKVSFKDYRYIGRRNNGDILLKYRVQVICNKCKSRGKPVITSKLLNPKPHISEWGNYYSDKYDECKQQSELFYPFVKDAIEAWNRRAEG